MSDLAVLMAVYNGQDHVRDAVESILRQDEVDFRLVIVDDGSTDTTPTILQDLAADGRIDILRNPSNMGLANSLNRALAEIGAAYVLRMDADDISLPGHLSTQLLEITRHQADICFCRFNNYKPETGVERLWPDTGDLRQWRVLFDNYWGPHCGVIYRRDAILSVGGYDPALERAEDYDLWDRSQQAGLKIIRHGQSLIRVTEHPGGVTRKHFEETISRSATVSRRAMKRILPDLTDEELDGIRWLMLRRLIDIPPAMATAGLDHCLRLAETFIARENLPPARAIWDDVSISLAVEYRRTSGALRAKARRRLFSTTWRTGSAFGVARCLRTLLAA